MNAKCERAGAAFRFIAIGCFVGACGDPIAGTESGNPINPTPPRYEPETTPHGPSVEPPGLVDPAPDGTPPVPPIAPKPEPDPPPPMTMPTAEPPLPPVDPEGCDPALCASLASEVAASLGAARTAPLPFSTATCVESNGGTACDCDGRVQVTSTGCALSDRIGACLYSQNDFPGCQLGNDSECRAVCDEIHTREVADAALAFSVEVRASACVDTVCRYVLTADDSCYTAEPLSKVDCARSDADLLAP